MHYKMGWKGSAAFQAFTPSGRELVFDLAEGLSVPNEFDEGDEIDIVLRSAHPANLAMGMNDGYYEFTHVKSSEVQGSARDQRVEVREGLQAVRSQHIQEWGELHIQKAWQSRP